VADITVQVSSAGLSAYGASTWSSNTYGGDNVSSTTVGSAEAFNNEGWGRLTWNSLVWGQDFENQTVQVNTPGNPTTWGSDVWGDAEWGQISGMDTDQGSAELTVSVDVSITGQELTSTVATAVAGASVLVSSTGEQSDTTVGDAFGGPNIEIQVSSPSNDPWGNTLVGWGNGLWGVGDGVTLLGNAVVNAQADANVEVTGQELQSGTDGAVLGVSILVELTNGSENVVEFTAYNQAQLSTAQQKFGSASLLLDGTNDYVESNSNVDLSSGDFTIDVWIRPSSVSGYKGIWQSGTSTTEQSYLLGNQVYWTVNPSTIITTSVTVNANEWTMLSYERQGNTHRIYKNGTLADTATTANKQDNGPFSIGENGFGDFNGYIDEFRLSDIARYGGSSFTEPTGAFTPDSNTTFLLHMDGANGSTNIVDDAPGVTIARFDIGEYFAGEVVEVQVTTASTQPWGELTWGDGDWGQSVGTDIAIGADAVLVPSIDVPVTGIDVNSTTGTLSITADANLSLTGQEVEILQGDENAFTDVTIEVSGQELTSELNNVVAGISQLIIPTGLEATATSGTMGINAWAVVEPNANTTWTVVDKAAA